MSLKIILPWTVAVLLLSACGSDGGSDGPLDDDDEDDSAASGQAHDASVNDGGVRDAGRDAGSHREDAGDSQLDAGSREEDAGTVGIEPDAGEDAGLRDAGQDAASADAGSSDAGGTSACDTLTYESFGQAFLMNYCVSCHGPTIAQKNVRLDSLAGVMAAKAKVKSEVRSGAMPPRGQRAPTSAERTQLGQWIDCGPR